MNIDSDQVKHLEMILSVIERLASNSFLLKGWALTVASGIVALAMTQDEGPFAFLGIAASLVFWGLDAFYLKLERQFRSLYEGVRSGKVIEPFSMNIAPFDTGVKGVISAGIGSASLILFHGAIAVMLVFTGVYLCWLS